MDMFSFLTEKEYRHSLRELLDRMPKEWGGISRLAREMNCQRSHISRVLRGHVQLTPDQAIAAAKAFGLPRIESEMFLLKVDLERAGSPLLKKHLMEKIKSLQREQGRIDRVMDRPSFSARELEVTYFSTWLYVAVHTLTACPEYQTVSALSKRLRISPEEVTAVLQKLKEYGLVAEARGKWKYQGSSIHMGKEQPLTMMHHSHWRHRAVHNVQLADKFSLHFSNIQAISEDDAYKIRQILLQALERTKAVADPSDSEEVYCTNLDFFKV